MNDEQKPESKAPSQAVQPKATSTASGPETGEGSKATFEQAASRQSPSVVAEFFDFLMTSKKWWLTPIIIVLLLVGVLVLLSTTAAAPFIYTLF